MIDSFMGEYRWLSNFHEAPLWHNGHLYQNSESAYQAAKLLPWDEEHRLKYESTDGKGAKNQRPQRSAGLSSRAATPLRSSAAWTWVSGHKLNILEATSQPEGCNLVQCASPRFSALENLKTPLLSSVLQ